MIDRIPVESIKAPTDKTYAFFYIVAPLIGPSLQKWKNILTPLNGGCGGPGLGFLNPSFASKASGVVPSKTNADRDLRGRTFQWHLSGQSNIPMV